MKKALLAVLSGRSQVATLSECRSRCGLFWSVVLESMLLQVPARQLQVMWYLEKVFGWNRIPQICFPNTDFLGNVPHTDCFHLNALERLAVGSVPSIFPNPWLRESSAFVSQIRGQIHSQKPRCCANPISQLRIRQNTFSDPHHKSFVCLQSLCEEEV